LTLLPLQRDAFAMNRVAFGFVALVAACGGSTTSGGDNSPACSAACGGDIVGRWQLVSTCGPSTYPMTMGSCTEPYTVERIGVTVTGTMEFLSDGTCSESMTFSGTSRMTYPAACLTIGGYTVTCNQLGTGCVAASAGGCACTTTVANQTLAATGTYSTSGSALTIQTTTSSSPSQYEYCAQGNRLTLTSLTSGDGGVAFGGDVGNVWEKLP
jgi:hypothetical protein